MFEIYECLTCGEMFFFAEDATEHEETKKHYVVESEGC